MAMANSTAKVTVLLTCFGWISSVATPQYGTTLDRSQKPIVEITGIAYSTGSKPEGSIWARIAVLTCTTLTLEDRGVLIRWAAIPLLGMLGCGLTAVLPAVMMLRATFLTLVFLTIPPLMSPLSRQSQALAVGSVVGMAVPGVRPYGTNTTSEIGFCSGKLSLHMAVSLIR
jgi:hypothetical protein